MSEDGNGNGLPDPEQLVRRKDLVDELVLTWDRMTCELKIGGRIVSPDAALAILAQATRFFETQLRLQAAQNIRGAQAEQQRVNALLERIRNTPRG